MKRTRCPSIKPSTGGTTNPVCSRAASTNQPMIKATKAVTTRLRTHAISFSFAGMHLAPLVLRQQSAGEGIGEHRGDARRHRDHRPHRMNEAGDGERHADPVEGEREREVL